MSLADRLQALADSRDQGEIEPGLPYDLCNRCGEDWPSHADDCEAVLFREVADENTRLLIALHDAIRRPMGVVPDSAVEFYDPGLADRAEAARSEHSAPLGDLVCVLLDRIADRAAAFEGPQIDFAREHTSADLVL